MTHISSERIASIEAKKQELADAMAAGNVAPDDQKAAAHVELVSGIHVRFASRMSPIARRYASSIRA